MAEFDSSFVVPGKQKIKIMIVKSYNYNQQNFQNLLTETAEIERLEQVQNKLDYVDIMRCIQNVSTCWNLTYYAWDHLFFLKDAIIQLQADLCTSTDRESKKDSNKLKRILLSDEEWSLLDQLIDILIPFKEVTCEFSGNTYVTLSQTIPTIKARIFDLASKVPQNVNEFLDEDTVFDFEIVETRFIDFDDDEVISNITKESISIKNSLDTTGILEKVKQNIYNALIYYWNILNDLGLMAALLDLHYKNLDFIEIDTEKERIIQKLRDEIGKVVIPESETLNNPAPSIDIESSIHSYKEYHQQRKSKTKKAILNMRIRSQNFPKLAKLVRKYLAIPATSVLSERQFSDVGNLISAKKTSLDIKLAGQMLFLKRNIKTMKVFAPKWDENIEIN
ncbi:1439_t:CDS:2 [Rhizophagus irregularis]|nr:1439_t:CDS:2 [Rhizophagus irregularis]